MDRSQLVAGGAIVAAMVLIPGLGKYALTELGYPAVGTIVWAGGYGIGAVLVWAIWIRPLDITGPENPEHPTDGDLDDS